MNNRSRFTLLCAVSVSLVPALSQAASERDALDACTRVMVAELSESKGSPIGYQYGEDSDYSTRRTNTASRFQLDAVDPKTNEVVAKAECVVRANGVVHRFRTLPLTAPDARARL